MASPIQLGFSPVSMTLALANSADFVTTLQSQDGDFPTSAAISIEVGTSTWTATIVGNEARFNVDQTEVDVVIAQSPRHFRLWYVDGETRLLWGSGTVLVRG